MERMASAGMEREGMESENCGDRQWSVRAEGNEMEGNWDVKGGE